MSPIAQIRRAATNLWENGMTFISHAADADTRATLKENGRTVISQGAAFVTDTAASARDTARRHGPVVAQQVKDLADKGITAARKSSENRSAQLTKLELEENIVRQRKLFISIAYSALQIVVAVQGIRKLRRAAKGK